MKLEGIHHITAITGDAVGTVYHLFYGDDDGSPGMDLTFFEYPSATRGTAGAGMVHRIIWRAASAAALEFWAGRLEDHDVAIERGDGEGGGAGLRFADPEGLEHELVVADVPDAPLRASADGIPAEHALLGFDGVRAYSADPAGSADLLGETLGFTSDDGGHSWEVRGDQRGSFYAYDPAPELTPVQGAGSVHHVAFAAQPEDEEAWRAHVGEGGAHPTQVIDRFYFRSIYFREPSGVLFEIATIGPGFAVDEDAEHLGERLSLPPRFEPLRERLQGLLKPLPYPRS